MKTKALLSALVMSGVLVVPHAALSRDDDYNRKSDWSDRWNDNDVRQLQGRWYVNGHSKKPAEINTDGKNLQARNEKGQTSRLQLERDGDIRALDWNGLHGNVRRDRIEWANGTTWTKNPQDRLSRR